MSAPDTQVETRLAQEIGRGVARWLDAQGYASLPEFTLASGRRADLMALGRGGDFIIVEVKSSVADFRSDLKWPEYRDYCDRLFFAVASGFPHEILPADCGLLVADAFGAASLREAPAHPLVAARRKAVTLRFALGAAGRLRRLADPGAVDFGLA